MPAPKGNKNAVGNKGGGRPSAYKPEYAQIAKVMCELGATNAELADAFQVGTGTINYWRAAHVEFSDAVRPAKEKADDCVEYSYFQRAVGYSYDAVKIFMPAGREKPVIVPYREHVPPDPNAGAFWLKNRRPEKWRDKHEVEHGGTLSLKDLSLEQIRERIAIELEKLSPILDLEAVRDPRGIENRSVVAEAGSEEEPSESPPAPNGVGQKKNGA